MRQRGGESFPLSLPPLGLLLAGVTLVCLWFAPELVALLAPGFDDPRPVQTGGANDPDHHPGPALLFLRRALHGRSVHKEKNFHPGPCPPWSTTLASSLAALPWGRSLAWKGFPWGVLGGAFAGNFLLQYYGQKNRDASQVHI